MSHIKEILKGVDYVGVNDRVTSRFESLWPIPNGVSYNSYIVTGSEKRALIDTVEIGGLPEFLHHLQSLGVENIDYLVVNHMEPDHSGSIPEILEMFPDLKIVGNRQTISMIGGYYGITAPERFHEVKDGDSLSLGDMTLRFYLTPMVHWPETMMTYLEERNLLFSGDGFGTFGALNGGVVDSEMDTEWYFPEMERYYSNIVGKYGKFVERALGKLSGLKVDYICSTHGPVWHKEVERVINLYGRLARYEAREGATIIYGSMYGHTAEVAEMFARALSARGIRNIRVHNAATGSISEMIADAFRYNILVVGSPTYSMRLFPPVEQFMNAIETRELKNREMITFGGHTWSPVSEKMFGGYIDRLGVNFHGHLEIKQSADVETEEKVRELVDQMMVSLGK